MAVITDLASPRRPRTIQKSHALPHRRQHAIDIPIDSAACLDGSQQVVEVLIQGGYGPRLGRSEQIGNRALQTVQIVRCVARPGRGRVAGRDEPFVGELPHHLEQPVARLVSLGVDDLDKRLVDQPPEDVQNVQFLRDVGHHGSGDGAPMRPGTPTAAAAPAARRE